MYFCGMFNLDKWDDDAKYMVMDDFEWKYVPNKKQLIGCQAEVELTDKYVRKKTKKWGKPVIYLCNEDQDPFVFMTEVEKLFWKENFVYYTLTSKLF